MAGRVTGDQIAVVVDANVTMATVLELPYAAKAVALFQELAGAEISVPMLWEYETASTLRKAVLMGRLTTSEAEDVLGRLLRLPHHRVAPDAMLHNAALRWAERIGQPVAYDAQYLALAERLGAAFWTADRRLAARAREAGAEWVHGLLDDE
jgi:predicted nucleic acid-binding protein